MNSLFIRYTVLVNIKIEYHTYHIYTRKVLHYTDTSQCTDYKAAAVTMTDVFIVEISINITQFTFL